MRTTVTALAGPERPACPPWCDRDDCSGGDPGTALHRGVVGTLAFPTEPGRTAVVEVTMEKFDAPDGGEPARIRLECPVAVVLDASGVDVLVPLLIRARGLASRRG